MEPWLLRHSSSLEPWLLLLGVSPTRLMRSNRPFGAAIEDKYKDQPKTGRLAYAGRRERRRERCRAPRRGVWAKAPRIGLGHRRRRTGVPGVPDRWLRRPAWTPVQRARRLQVGERGGAAALRLRMGRRADRRAHRMLACGDRGDDAVSGGAALRRLAPGPRRVAHPLHDDRADQVRSRGSKERCPPGTSLIA